VTARPGRVRLAIGDAETLSFPRGFMKIRSFDNTFAATLKWNTILEESVKIRPLHDRVLLKRLSEAKIEGQEYVIVREDEILGVFTE
jgi:hypothetical protein